MPRPPLPTSELAGSWWLPQNRYTAVHRRADEIPLPTAEMARLCHEIDPLIELSKLDAEPSLVGAAHISRDKTRSYFAPAVGSGLNNSPSNKAI